MSETISQGATGGIASAYEAGNEADFERLYQASYGKILGTLTAMVGDRAAAEDCGHPRMPRRFQPAAERLSGRVARGSPPPSR
jgi:hypothetical protein